MVLGSSRKSETVQNMEDLLNRSKNSTRTSAAAIRKCSRLKYQHCMANTFQAGKGLPTHRKCSRVHLLAIAREGWPRNESASEPRPWREKSKQSCELTRKSAKSQTVPQEPSPPNTRTNICGMVIGVRNSGQLWPKRSYRRPFVARKNDSKALAEGDGNNGHRTLPLFWHARIAKNVQCKAYPTRIGMGDLLILRNRSNRRCRSRRASTSTFLPNARLLSAHCSAERPRKTCGKNNCPSHIEKQGELLAHNATNEVVRIPRHRGRARDTAQYS